MYPVSFPCGLLHDIYRKKVVAPYGASPYCPLPGCIVTWAWSLAKGQYMVEWLLTGTPKQRYWQNRETTNIGLVSSVGRAPARQSGGRRFKSRSRKFSLFIQNLSKKCTWSVSLVPGQFPLWFITWVLVISESVHKYIGIDMIKKNTMYIYCIKAIRSLFISTWSVPLVDLDHSWHIVLQTWCVRSQKEAVQSGRLNRRSRELYLARAP